MSNIRNIALLGSTGSIGKNVLDVIASHKDKFRLVSIACGENIGLLIKQVNDFSPEVISVKKKEDAEKLKSIFPDKKIFYGNDGIMEVALYKKVDTMISAINGTTSIEATIESIRNNHRICLANKETLVAAGELINRELDSSNAELIPIDSEQSAIFQCLIPYKKEFVKNVILTASGGPFLKRNKEDFYSITIEQALSHPTWSMGSKITIDSATLMNKALEVIEAFYLFRLNKNQINVIIHPQSIIHSMVEFIDSSIIAQLSVADMRIPILYSLSYPERIKSNTKCLSFSDIKKLEFFDVDIKKFSSIEMALYVLENGKNAGAVLNAANEVAAESFLNGEIRFDEIFNIVGEILHNERFYQIDSISNINETIEEIKRKTNNYIKRRHIK